MRALCTIAVAAVSWALHQENALGSAVGLLGQYVSLFQPTLWALACILWGHQNTTGLPRQDTRLMLCSAHAVHAHLGPAD